MNSQLISSFFRWIFFLSHKKKVNWVQCLAGRHRWKNFKTSWCSSVTASLIVDRPEKKKLRIYTCRWFNYRHRTIEPKAAENTSHIIVNCEYKKWNSIFLSHNQHNPQHPEALIASAISLIRLIVRDSSKSRALFSSLPPHQPVPHWFISAYYAFNKVSRK